MGPVELAPSFPNRTPEAQRRRVLQLGRKRRWGAAHIGFEVGLAASTVQAILNASGVGRLDQGDRATHTQSCQRSGISVNAPAS